LISFAEIVGMSGGNIITKMAAQVGFKLKGIKEGGSPLLFIFPLSLRERGTQGVRAKKAKTLS